MSRSFPVFALLALAACSSTSPSTPVPAPERAEEARQSSAADQARQDIHRVLITLDQALESYARLLDSHGVPRADIELVRLERLLRELVNGTPTLKDGKMQDKELVGSKVDALIAIAADSSNKDQQGIALASLGFAEPSKVMPVILAGAQSSDPQLVDRAIFGLAVKHDPTTPPGVIMRVIEDKEHSEDGRLQAAWALFVLQDNGAPTDEILPYWRHILNANIAKKGEYHPLIVATAVRGLGITRKPDDADLVANFLQDPTPRVRWAAAIALGRMNAQSHWKELLELIGPGENVPNVRLAGRKALQALAGGADRQYDQAAWRMEFDRSSRATKPDEKK
jgi:HEAT repeat protein